MWGGYFYKKIDKTHTILYSKNMKKKRIIIGVFILLALIAIGGWFWCSENWEREGDTVQITQKKESDSLQESIADEQEQPEVEDDRPTTLQYQDRKDLVWYEIPEFGLRFQIFAHSKDSYDKLRSDLKAEGESLVWYEVSELGIKFLISPEGKEDLRYVIHSSPKDAEWQASTAVFYLDSFKYLGWCKDDPEVCLQRRLSRIRSNDLVKLDSRYEYPFCGINDPYFTIDSYSFCVSRAQASPFSSEEEMNWFFEAGYGKGAEVIYESSVLLNADR